MINSPPPHLEKLSTFAYTLADVAAAPLWFTTTNHASSQYETLQNMLSKCPSALTATGRGRMGQQNMTTMRNEDGHRVRTVHS